MPRVWSMPIDLSDPQDRQVATWLAAQPDPATAVKKLILAAATGKTPPARLIDLVPSILQEVQALRAEVHHNHNQNHNHSPSDPPYAEVLHELRALRADLARVGAGELPAVQPPPENPESGRRLDALFQR